MTTPTNRALFCLFPAACPNLSVPCPGRRPESPIRTHPGTAELFCSNTSFLLPTTKYSTRPQRLQASTSGGSYYDNSESYSILLLLYQVHQGTHNTVINMSILLYMYTTRCSNILKTAVSEGKSRWLDPGGGVDVLVDIGAKPGDRGGGGGGAGRSPHLRTAVGSFGCSVMLYHPCCFATPLFATVNAPYNARSIMLIVNPCSFLQRLVSSAASSALDAVSRLVSRCCTYHRPLQHYRYLLLD